MKEVVKDGLIELREKLQVDRELLLDELQSIDDTIASIEKILSSVNVQTEKNNDRQLTLAIMPRKRVRLESKSQRFKDITFYKAINILFKENPGKMWKPAELADAVICEGFTTRSKKFKNTVRTLLLNMRKDNRIGATRTKGGWLYGDIKKDSVSFTDETESLNNTGGLPE